MWQSLTEGLLLAFTGGGLGLLLAWRGADALVAAMGHNAAPGFSRTLIALRVAPDWSTLGFTLGVSLLTGLLSGLGSSIQSSRTAPSRRSRVRGSAFAGTWPQLRLRQILIVTQMALCLVLLMGAGLFVRTLQSLKDGGTGLDRAHLLQMEIDPDPYRRLAAGQKQQYYRELLVRIEKLPGVRSMARSMTLLMTNDAYMWKVSIDGREPRAGETCRDVEHCQFTLLRDSRHPAYSRAHLGATG